MNNTGHGFTFGRIVEDGEVRMVLLCRDGWPPVQLGAQAVTALIGDLEAALDIGQSVSGSETDVTCEYPVLEDTDELDPRLGGVLEPWQPDDDQKRATLELWAKYAGRDPGFAAFYGLYCDDALAQRDFPQRWLALAEFATQLLIGSWGERQLVKWLVAAAGEDDL